MALDAWTSATSAATTVVATAATTAPAPAPVMGRVTQGFVENPFRVIVAQVVATGGGSRRNDTSPYVHFGSESHRILGRHAESV